MAYRTLSLPAETCADRLHTILRSLRELCDAADDEHDLLVNHDLAPDADGCVPDELRDLIGTVEAHIAAIGAQVPA